MSRLKLSRFESLVTVREALARLEERRKVPQRLNRFVPRDGTSNPDVTRVCEKVWSYHDRLFPRRCEFCCHFDFKLGQDSLNGRTVESEEEAANLTAQRHLFEDYVWDVDGGEVTVRPEDLGGCTVHEAYVAREMCGCEHFERTPGGALVPLEARKTTTPEELTGWKAPADVQDDVEVPAAVVYPEGYDAQGVRVEPDRR